VRMGRRGRMTAIFGLISVVAAASIVILRGGTGPASATDVQIQAAHGSSFVPALQGKRPLFILALGSDARPGQTITRERADSIHLIGINLRNHQATILGFPRDSWVNIPGYGTAKINTAMTAGGPDLMVRTIESLTNIRIDFWLLTSFTGFTSMVNRIGGLTVRVPLPMHDRYSGADFSAGKHHFNGQQALAFARDRHDVPGGDLGRSANQGRLFLAALSKLRSSFRGRPATVLDWIGVGWRHISSDLDVGTLLNLGLTATQVRKVNNLVVPATTGSVGPQSVVFISPSAASVFADMRADGVASA
jgi:LCP family protein required for cell wall assembly